MIMYEVRKMNTFRNLFYGHKMFRFLDSEQ